MIEWYRTDGTPKTTAELFEDIRDLIRQGYRLEDMRDGFKIVPPKR